MAGTYFQWTEEYAVGVRLIDNDHRELFAIINDLHAEIEETVSALKMREITDRLIRYTQEHFAREEHLMSEYGYTGLAEHRKKHHDFIRMVHAIRKIESDCPDRLDPNRLLQFLESWLRRHILHSDREYIPALKGDYGRRKSDNSTALQDMPKEEGEEQEAEEADKPEQEELVTISVQVPYSAVDTLRRCAQILSMDENRAAEIRAITDPITRLTIEDALAIANILLRPA